jgi:hypothetical protein
MAKQDTSKYNWVLGPDGRMHHSNEVTWEHQVYEDNNGMVWEDVDNVYNSPFRNMDLGTVLARNSAGRYSCSERGEYVSRADKEAEVLRKKVVISDGTKTILAKYTSEGEATTYMVYARLALTAAALTTWCQSHKIMLYDWDRYQSDVHIKVALQAAKIGIISKGRNTSKATLIARMEAAIAEYGTALLELQPVLYHLVKIGVLPRSVIAHADSALWSFTKRCV